MSDWYLFNEEGPPHRGPFSSEAIAMGIVKGEIARDALVAMDAWFESAPGQSGWKRADEIEAIAQQVVTMSQRAVRAAARASAPPVPPTPAPKPPEQTLQIVDGAHRYDHRGTPDFGATIMMVADEKAKGE